MTEINATSPSVSDGLPSPAEQKSLRDMKDALLLPLSELEDDDTEDDTGKVKSSKRKKEKTGKEKNKKEKRLKKKKNAVRPLTDQGLQPDTGTPDADVSAAYMYPETDGGIPAEADLQTNASPTQMQAAGYYEQPASAEAAEYYEQPASAEAAGYYEQPASAEAAGYYEQPASAEAAGYYEQPASAEAAGYYEQPASAEAAGYYEQPATAEAAGYYEQPAAAEAAGYYEQPAQTDASGLYDQPVSAQPGAVQTVHIRRNDYIDRASAMYVPPQTRPKFRELFGDYRFMSVMSLVSVGICIVWMLVYFLMLLKRENMFSQMVLQMEMQGHYAFAATFESPVLTVLKITLSLIPVTAFLWMFSVVRAEKTGAYMGNKKIIFAVIAVFLLIGAVAVFDLARAGLVFDVTKV